MRNISHIHKTKSPCRLPTSHVGMDTFPNLVILVGPDRVKNKERRPKEVFETPPSNSEH